MSCPILRHIHKFFVSGCSSCLPRVGGAIPDFTTVWVDDDIPGQWHGCTANLHKAAHKFGVATIGTRPNNPVASSDAAYTICEEIARVHFGLRTTRKGDPGWMLQLAD
eukprot:CAMPEP_0169161762 /NCGR_PEP_ID=MMETSP1015-20121227/57236_1 /TAXON_ID=342587 /ORGANISM="Karlodinium micrum, Strain CCMP2283" /LENGTH=107 /DNA_ID=CAMNT_0009233677 /DNA_START=91 /DNA_END=414 /DNA_ORIENTATION=-